MHQIPEITKRQGWFEIDDGRETMWVPDSYDLDDLQWETDRTYEITRRTGFGCRMSAPGYTDCTDWAVFETEEGCAEYLADTYFEGSLDEMDPEELTALADLLETMGDNETLEKVRKILEPEDD